MASDQELKGIAVISINTGQKLGVVDQIALDPSGRHVAAFTVHSGGNTSMITTELPDASWLPVKKITAVGPDAITVRSTSALQASADEQDLILSADILKRKVVTKGGTYLGDIAALHFDEKSLDITSFEISHGFLKSSTEVSIDHLINIGEAIVIVDDAADPESADSPDASGNDEEQVQVKVDKVSKPEAEK